MTILNAADLAGKSFEFTEEIARFALFDNNFVILLLDDREMTQGGIDHLIRLTGRAIVKVHAINTCRTVQILSGYVHSASGATPKITQEILNRMQKIPLSPPFAVKLSENIPRVIEFQTKKSIFVSPNGQVMPHMDRLKAPQKRTVASLAGATEYVVDLLVTQEVTEIASQYRSAPTY